RGSSRFSQWQTTSRDMNTLEMERPTAPPPTSHTLGWPAFYHAHVGFVLRVMRKFVGPDADVEDLVQEAFIVVHRRLPEFDGRVKATTWLYQICWRIAAAHRRKKQLRRLLWLDDDDLGELPSRPSADPGKSLDDASLNKLVYEVLDCLSAPQRQTLI